MDREQVLSSYGQAWGLQEELDIRAALARCLSASTTYQNPLTDTVRGIEGLTNLILDFPVMFPGASLRPTSPPEIHHDVACFPWQLSSTARIRIQGHDYGKTLEGIDVVEFGGDDRILRVTAFFGYSRRETAATHRRFSAESRPSSGREPLVTLEPGVLSAHQYAS